MIAQYLTKRAGDNLATFLNSEEVKAALFSEDYEILHPMYDDIRRCLAMLIPIQTGSYLHELVDTPIAWDSSIKALFEIAPSYVTGDCTDLLTHLSQNPDNLKLLLKLAITTIGHVGHPLNASFWSGILKNLSMPERDISWTEYVRQNAERFDRILEDLELACRRDTPLPEVMEYRLHLLAEHVIWTLTSTVRALRDKATRALYWYGRRFPRAFLDLVISSLELNDPYVPERMLAATYGIAMARQHDFSDPSFVKSVLPDYGRRLYEEIFSPHAAHSTTHTLARDYARHTIDVALLHHPDLLTAGERKRTIPPFTDGGIREWGESEDKN